MKLVNYLLAPPHWHGEDDAPPGKFQLEVQVSCVVTDSRLDDDLSVAVLEFTDTPKWLRYVNRDPYGFPKKTDLGTLWRGVNTAEQDEHGQTEFIRAAVKDNLLYAEALAEFADTDINVQDIHGRTALHWACVKSLPNIVMLCLSVPGCDVSLRDKDNLTAFDLSQGNDELIPNLFYKNILEMDETDPQGALLRVLTVTSEPTEDKAKFPGAAIFEPIQERNSALVTALIRRGVDLTARNTDGDTALHIAAAQVDSADIATSLLEAGSDINAKGASGATPLHHAAHTADEEMVTVLLHWQADVDVKDSDEKTALHLAAENGQLDVARVLLGHGADTKAEDRAGQTPLQLAEDSKEIDLVGLLKEVNDAERLAEEAQKQEKEVRPSLSDIE